LKEFWDPIKASWSDHSEARRKALNVLVVPATTTFQYADGVTDLSRISPDNWVHDQALLDRPVFLEAATRGRYLKKERARYRLRTVPLIRLLPQRAGWPDKRPN
jgi:hypothetical protein